MDVSDIGSLIKCLLKKIIDNGGINELNNMELKYFIKLCLYSEYEGFENMIKKSIDEILSKEKPDMILRTPSTEKNFLLYTISELMDKIMDEKYVRAENIYSKKKFFIKKRKMNYKKLLMIIFDDNTPIIIMNMIRYIFEKSNECTQGLGYITVSMLLIFSYYCPYLAIIKKHDIDEIKKFNSKMCCFENGKIPEESIDFINNLLDIYRSKLCPSPHIADDDSLNDNLINTNNKNHYWTGLRRTSYVRKTSTSTSTLINVSSEKNNFEIYEDIVMFISEIKISDNHNDLLKNEVKTIERELAKIKFTNKHTQKFNRKKKHNILSRRTLSDNSYEYS